MLFSGHRGMDVVFWLYSAVAFAFSDQTVAAQLLAPHVPAYSATTTYAAGGAVADVDRDGHPDVFVLSGGGIADQLFLNNGDGTFSEVGAAWGVDIAHQGTGATAADVDGDGWIDLFVTSLGDVRSRSAANHKLYLNQQGNGFVEVAALWGVDSIGASDGWGGSFGDIDLDGDLDLFVPAYLSGANTLFRNDGDHFTDITAAQGLQIDRVAGFAARFADMDGDLWPELILIGDFNTSRYFRNDHGQFIDSTPTTGLGNDGSEMGIAVADLDEDGRLDLYVSTIGTNNLHLNRGNHRFMNFGGAAGVEQAGWGWGTVDLDLDHDTHLDLAVTSQTGRQFLFHHSGQRPLRFTETAVPMGLDSDISGRGMSRLDYDRDGDLDLLIFPFGDQVTLFRNDLVADDTTHWLTVQLDPAGRPGIAPDGVGSRVEVELDGRLLIREIDAGGFLSNSELTAHFGLGDHGVIDVLRVRWADGSITHMTDVPSDQHLTLRPRGLVPDGADASILTIDGSTGGEEKRIAVHPGQTVSIDLGWGIHGPRQANFMLQGQLGVATSADRWSHPSRPEPMLVMPCRLAPDRPDLLTLATNLPDDACMTQWPSPAPLSVDFTMPLSGPPITLQAIVQHGWGARSRVVVSNAVLLDPR